MSFTSSVDIANRALQICGLPRLDTTLGFGDGSQRAAETQSAYGKVKRAELRRTVFQFATRRSALRPMDVNARIVAPTLWSSSVSYFRGSIVSDGTGFLWISTVQNNKGTDPTTPSSAWQPYFGPLTVMAYQGTTAYFSGELVYTAAGDGTYNVYQSQVSGNSIDPSLPNQWNTSETYNLCQVVQTFPAWLVGTTYSAGQGVTYTDGNTYVSLIGGNVGNVPPTSGSDWALMPILSITPTGFTPQFGQTQLASTVTSPVTEWNLAQVYGLGSFVMFNANQYVSIVANNTGNYPNAAGSTSWAQVTNGTVWQSLIDLNTGNNPANTAAAWSSLTTYATGNVVAATDGLNYTSLQNSNLNHNPANGANPTFWQAGSATAWTSTLTGGSGNQQWLLIGGAAFANGVGTVTPNIIYPLGSGPSSQLQTRNIYRLPAGFLREAPQDPKAGSTSWLGAPSGLWYTDWEYEGDYIVTRNSDPIIYRFVADVTDVTQFDDMFCEGLALRLALAVAFILTNSEAKVQEVAGQYSKFMGEARIVAGIEVGAVEPAQDDFISCRL